MFLRCQMERTLQVCQNFYGMDDDLQDPIMLWGALLHPQESKRVFEGGSDQEEPWIHSGRPEPDKHLGDSQTF
jgi:hypothetical protein